MGKRKSRSASRGATGLFQGSRGGRGGRKAAREGKKKGKSGGKVAIEGYEIGRFYQIGELKLKKRLMKVWVILRREYKTIPFHCR